MHLDTSWMSGCKRENKGVSSVSNADAILFNKKKEKECYHWPLFSSGLHVTHQSAKKPFPNQIPFTAVFLLRLQTSLHSSLPVAVLPRKCIWSTVLDWGCKMTFTARSLRSQGQPLHVQQRRGGGIGAGALAGSQSWPEHTGAAGKQRPQATQSPWSSPRACSWALTTSWDKLVKMGEVLWGKLECKQHLKML